jgi:hypothetical protein
MGKKRYKETNYEGFYHEDGEAGRKKTGSLGYTGKANGKKNTVERKKMR